MNNQAEYHSNKDAFDKIMGGCAGVDVTDLTDHDIHEQATIWVAAHEHCSKEMIQAAFAGLIEYKRDRALANDTDDTICPGCECPNCEEADIDSLVWLCDERIQCQSCQCVYKV